LIKAVAYKLKRRKLTIKGYKFSGENWRKKWRAFIPNHYYSTGHWTRTLDLEMMRQVRGHCAITADQQTILLKCGIIYDSKKFYSVGQLELGDVRGKTGAEGSFSFC
jgi:hypothetical protein